MNKSIFYIVFLFLLVLLSCKKDKISDARIDYSYFPLDTTSWIIYKVKEISIDSLVNKYDTSEYYVKEIISGKYQNSTGDEMYRIERYTRTNDSSAWVIKDVWNAELTPKAAYKTEENIRYIKLVFPANYGYKWDGNAYNNLDPQQYEITDIDIPDSLNSLSFDSVLTVTQDCDSSLLHKDYTYEKFAKHIGLIERYLINVTSDISFYGTSLPIEQRITTATIYHQKIIDYSKNPN